MKAMLSVAGLKKKRMLACALCLLVLVVPGFAPRLMAQTAAGSVSGEVRDVSQALVVGASVTLTDTSTRLTRKTTTNNAGVYEFAEVQPGTYELEVKKTGFHTSMTQFALEVAQEQRFDINLLVGSADTVIEVHADTVTVDRASSSLGTVISSEEVKDLPLDGRNVFGLAGLAPGVLPGGGFGAGLSTERGAVVAAGANNFRANGGISGSNEILLDGIPVTVCCQGQPAVIPSVDIVSQFKVQTNVPPANFGRSSGGALNIVTKSGASRVTGDLYEYIRNTIFDANDWFANHEGQGRLPLVYNQFGGTLGGPLWIPHVLDERKTFFFFGFEGVQSSRKTHAITTVPTALQRSGDLSEGPGIVYSPTQTVTVGGVVQRAPLPNNAAGKCCVVPQMLQNPIAQSLLALWPLPNLTGLAVPYINNYGYSAPQFDSDWQYSGRIDRTVNSRYNFFLRGTYSTNEDLRGSLFGTFTEPNSQSQALRAAVIEWDNTILLSPSILLNAHYGFSWQTNVVQGGALNQSAATYGFPGGLTAVQQTPGLPTNSVSGYASLGVESATQLRHYTHAVGANMIWQHGRQTIQAGYDGRLFVNNVFPATNGAGTFAYSTTFTVGPLGSSKPVTGQAQFDSFASFLFGLPTGGSIATVSKFAYEQPYSAVYFQDDWRILPNLTLNLGVRYDLENGPVERHDKLSQLNPVGTNPLATTLNLPFAGTIEFGGVGRSRRMWQMPLYEFAPRVGAVYALNNAAMLRAGYGIFYLPTTQRLYDAGNPSYSVTTNYVASVNGGQTASGSLSNPYPTGIAQIQGASSGPTAQTGSSVTGVLYNSVPGYVQQWNAGSMLQLHPAAVFTVSYAGAHGVRLPISLTPNDINPIYFSAPCDSTASASCLAEVNQLEYSTYPNPFQPYVSTGSLSSATITRPQLLAAFPQYTGVTEQYVSRGLSSYNSLQSSLRVKTGNVTSTIAYTWSKSLGNVNNNTTSFLDTGSPAYQNSYNLRNERAVDPADITQRFTAATIMQLPFGRGQRFLRAVPHWLNTIVGDWSLTTITTVQSGLPLNITDSGQPLLAGSRPNRVPGVLALTSGPATQRLGGNNSGTGYLNPAAFSYPLAFQFGNVPRLSSDLRAPGVLNSDVSGLKAIALHGTWRMQLRGEAFNVFNRAQFAAPATTYGLATFGTITAQQNLPRQIQIAIKLFW